MREGRGQGLDMYSVYSPDFERLSYSRAKSQMQLCFELFLLLPHYKMIFKLWTLTSTQNDCPDLFYAFLLFPFKSILS